MDFRERISSGSESLLENAGPFLMVEEIDALVGQSAHEQEPGGSPRAANTPSARRHPLLVAIEFLPHAITENDGERAAVAGEPCQNCLTARDQ